MSKTYGRLLGIKQSLEDVAHVYDSVDNTIVADVLRQNFPKLKSDAKTILKTLDKK